MNELNQLFAAEPNTTIDPMEAFFTALQKSVLVLAVAAGTGWLIFRAYLWLQKRRRSNGCWP